MLHGSYYCLDMKESSVKKPTKKDGLDLVDLQLWQCWPDSKQQSESIVFQKDIESVLIR
jgi:hypothetical protein